MEALPRRQVFEKEFKVELVAPLLGHELLRGLGYYAFES